MSTVGRDSRESGLMDITDPAIEDYIRGLLARHDEPVLLEMEAEAEEKGFPIVGRMVGVVLEILARSIGARRVFELGSGYGYSGYWFARAVGSGGELHLTDGDPENEKKAQDYLSRAGLWEPVRFHVGDAVTSMNATDGQQVAGAPSGPPHPPTLEPTVQRELHVLLRRSRAVHPAPRSHVPEGVEVVAVVDEVRGQLEGLVWVASPPAVQELGGQPVRIGEGPVEHPAEPG